MRAKAIHVVSQLLLLISIFHASFALFTEKLMRRGERRCASRHRWPNYKLGQYMYLLFSIWYCRQESKPRLAAPSRTSPRDGSIRASFVITYFTGWRQLRRNGNNVTVFIIFSIIVVILWISGLIEITGVFQRYRWYRSIAITWQYFRSGDWIFSVQPWNAYTIIMMKDNNNHEYKLFQQKYPREQFF